MIRAEVHSDDYRMKAEFDATPWFENVGTEEFKALIDCNFRGDYITDDVAQFMEEFVPEIEAVMEYVRHTPEMGFECSVNEDDAKEWGQGVINELARI